MGSPMKQKVHPAVIATTLAVLLVAMGYFAYKNTLAAPGYNSSAMSAETPKPPANSPTFDASKSEHILTKGGKVDLNALGPPPK